MSTKQDLLRDIKEFLKETGMSASTFGMYAVANSHLVARLEKGGGVSTDVADRVHAYMATEKKRRGGKKGRPLGRAALAV